MEFPFSGRNMPTATGHRSAVRNAKTLGGIPVAPVQSAPFNALPRLDTVPIRLRLELERLKLLRGFDELLCLEDLRGVEEMPHQIETVRKVLRYFHGRVPRHLGIWSSSMRPITARIAIRGTSSW